MPDPIENPTIDLQPPDTAPTLTRLGSEIAREAPTNFAPPGFEILGELGRGGMGVVYRARQKSLNRLVALKVILGAGHAGTDQLTRFRAEATTAAQLQHPNIVQVFEVGEHEGQPFFSLELIEGGSLGDRLKGEPQQPREAAELIRTLAEAVQHAHSKGVIHRDLKPANILLSNLNSTSIKITDFGLAKQQSTNSKLTNSGAILGTPSYMAPEQAAGDGALIGPATDVYALGAILYELLTGRPPFRAAAVMDTIMQVLHGEPVPPSRLEPKLPRDLETICLKCLEKKPEQRYHSAQALADDLGRFLKGEPIQARPVSSLTKSWKWARRHPALAAIVFILAVPLPMLLGVMVYLFVEARSAKQQVEAEKAEVERARKDAERERELAQEYLKGALGAMERILERVGDEKLTRIPALQEERNAIMSEALAFFETLLRIDSNDPRVREETAQTFLRMSRVSLLGGRTDQAAKASQGSVELYIGLADQFPERPELRNDLAQSYMFLGHSLVLNSDFEGGLKAYEAGARLAESLSREFPNEPSYRATAAECRRILAYFYSNASGGGEGESNFKEALRLSKELHAQNPKIGEYRALYASVLGAYAQFLVNRGRLPDAAPLVADGMQLIKHSRDSLPRSGPARLHYDQGAIMLRLSAAMLEQRDGKKGRSLELLREATAGYEKLIATQPQAFPYRLQAIQAYTAMVRVLRTEKNHAEAVKASARVVELHEEMVRDFPVFRELPRSTWFHNQRVMGMQLHLNSLLNAEQFDELRKFIAEVEKAQGMNGVHAYNVGCVYAKLATKTDDESQREMDIAKAMEWLRKGEAGGYPVTPQDVEHVRTKDEDLAILRSRPEFQEWAKKLKPKKT